MIGITKPLTVNGFTNLGALLRAAGFVGDKLRMLLIDNPSTTVPVYVHFTASNLSAGLTGTDGIPLSAGAFPARRNLELVAGAQDFPELNHIWLYTASSIPITVAAIGN